MKAGADRSTVLIVDDAPANLQVLGQALSADYELTMATSGSEALRIVSSDAPPDLILLDIIMPEMDGYEVCRALKSNEKTRDIPIIFVTVRSEEEDETKGLELGAIDYITKPFSLPIVKARVKNHIELKRNRDLAESAVRARSEFLAAMSHEIRTPLNAILGTIEVLLGTELTVYQRERLQVLEFAGDALMALLNDVLDLSKIEAGVFHLEENDFEIREVLSKALYLLQLQAQDKNLLLRSSVGKGVPGKLRGDKNRLRQIVINLVDNAIKFTEQGEIVVRVDLENEFPEELVVRFTVSDTGIGIPPEDREEIFKRFKQAGGSRNRKNRGAGLGLAISSRLTEAMGGRMWVESELEKGSTFHFTVRLQPPHAEDRAETQDSQVLRARSDLVGTSILVVDDNLINQGIATTMLRSLGCTVQVASNGVEAVTAFDTQDFDVILMDGQMPEMDGLEATRIIRDRERKRSAKSVVIIGQSAHSSGEYERLCLASGMNDYIAKPLRKQDLHARLQKHLAGRRL